MYALFSFFKPYPEFRDYTNAPFVKPPLFLYFVMDKNFHLGLLYLIHLLAGADGDFSEHELNALKRVRSKEKIPDNVFQEFEHDVKNFRERDIYQKGIACIKSCTPEEKLKTFALLYKISEIDGRVHVKEVKLLLYSIEHAGIEFDDVVQAANFSNDVL
jgi:uncharacterized tellurite resistance protein B-like protein